jgi:hypothetical protein
LSEKDQATVDGQRLFVYAGCGRSPAGLIHWLPPAGHQGGGRSALGIWWFATFYIDAWIKEEENA